MGFFSKKETTKEIRAFDTSALTTTELAELDINIDAIINRSQGNRQAINRLVFESVSAMTTSDEYAQELSNKKGIRRFIGGITGSNKALQDKINHNRSIAQYASQQTLQKLAEQNVLSFDLIAAVNNKLNASMVQIEGEINQIYDYLFAFFKQTRSDMISLESRLEKLERNVNLLNWQNSIEYQMFNGVEYAELDDAEKIVCLARDFYEITQGNWTTSDLLLLKTAMATIDLSPKENGNYYEFIKRLAYDNTLCKKLFGNQVISRQPNPEYLPLLSGLNKINLLGTSEQYIVSSVSEQTGGNNESIIDGLTKSFLKQEGEINAEFDVPYYELVLELVYNLRQANDEELLGESVYNDNAVPQEIRYKQATELFKTYNPLKALPLLEELSNEGYAKANALIYWIYRDGWYKDGAYYIDENKGKEYLKKGYQSGDILSSALYGLFCDNSNEWEITRKTVPMLEEMAKSGDVLAENTLGIVYVNKVFGEPNYVEAMQHFIKAKPTEFYRAAYGAFLRYYKGEHPFTKDYIQASLWADYILNFGCPYHISNVAYMSMNIEDYNCNTEEEKNMYYKSAIELWKDLEYNGYYGSASTNLGWMYENGRGVEKDYKQAFKHYLLAAEKGCDVGQMNLAYSYRDGTGTEKDLDKAIYWYRKSAEQGNEIAKKELERLT